MTHAFVQSVSPVWLCDPMDCSPPGSSVCGIFLARILEWVAISSSREFSWPRDQPPQLLNCRWILYQGVTGGGGEPINQWYFNLQRKNGLETQFIVSINSFHSFNHLAPKMDQALRIHSPSLQGVFCFLLSQVS